MVVLCFVFRVYDYGGIRMVKMEKTGIVSIAIVGAESTGKTELCRTLAAH